MQRKAKAALRKAALNTLAVIFFLAMLPGCAVVGPLLSVGSFIGAAPLQYASAVYTVGEYTYEYAANDKDPSEVIEGKILAVLDGSAFEVPDFSEEDGTGEVMLADGKPATKVEVLEATMAAKAEEPRLTKAETVEAAISAQARKERVEQILGRRTLQFERLELRRMAFLKARSGGELSLRQTSLATSPDLFQGSGKTTLR